MFLVNPNSTIILILIIIIASIILTYVVQPINYKDSRVYVLMSVLSGLSIVVTLFFYYGTVQLNARQQRLAIVQETANISNMLIEELYNEMVKASEIIPNFVASITPIRNSYYAKPDKQTEVQQAERTFLSEKIFSIWQYILISDEFTANEPLSYITRFLQNANSKQLYVEWLEGRNGFNKATQMFGDLLFEYALPVTDQRPEVYDILANKFINDSRYQAIKSTI